jgi:hypothetical protein
MERVAILRKLDSIGDDVEEEEIVHHCGEDAPLELFEAEAEGLVESKTFFTLTDKGRASLAHEVAA